jgi:GT2 family glycosyltransferase
VSEGSPSTTQSGSREISVLAHIVTFNHAATLGLCLEALHRSVGCALEVIITDNCSADNSHEIAARFGVQAKRNGINLGFCAGHNGIIGDFLKSEHTHLCILNPDVAVSPDCLAILARNCEELATPKLLRGDDALNPVTPPRIDAAGMILTTSLRHFDRGSQQLDGPEYGGEEFVFGGTGACLMVSRSALERLLLPYTPFDHHVAQIHPGTGQPGTLKLLDEAFFAYREDAELAWRAQRLGLRCRYVPAAIAVHKRVVLPENRSDQSAFVNRLGVRNRFLLQGLHFSQRYYPALLPGFVFRNLIVIAGVLLRERTSLRAFRELWILRKRTRFLRNWFATRAVVSDTMVSRWLIQESERC